MVNWAQQTSGVESIVAVESFDVATQRSDPRLGVAAASPTEWRLRSLAEVPANDRRGRLTGNVVSRGMEMRSDRLNGRFTRFNSNVSAIRDLVTVIDQAHCSNDP